MLSTRSIVSMVVLWVLLAVGALAHSQDARHEDLSPCSGSSPEPGQSSVWAVAFCNRTGHDIVIEFHDNDCPAQNWSRRGDVYQRSMRRGESITFPMCYANEPKPTAALAPGIPTLRIPGGKGVVTTWSVVGDCGDRSDRLNLDARTFYDRGDYKTGIILLQHPAGASHCVAQASGSARPAVQAPAESQGAVEAHPSARSTLPAGAPSVTPAPASAAAPAASLAPSAPPAPAGKTAPSVVVPPMPTPVAGQPTLRAFIDANDIIFRTVRVFAVTAPGDPNYQCNFTLALTFTDGGGWSDRVKADIHSGQLDSPVATRKYGKSVAKVDLTSVKCAAQ